MGFVISFPSTRAGRSALLVTALLGGALLAPAAHAMTWIPTNFGVGADAEVRESNPTQNRGASTELASRVQNSGTAGDRQSAIYTKFDLSGTLFPDDFTTAFRMTYRNNNLTEARIQDAVTPNPAARTGLAIYGLDPTAMRANWDESTITYLNAPGITPDGDVGTKDFNGDLTLLGTVLFPEIGTQNHLPIGGELVFASANLDQFIADAIGNGISAVTLVSTVIHGGDTPFPTWTNFNYLFNPKEQTTLNSDDYDPDITDALPDIGNAFGTDNSTGAFSPSLLIQAVPEPATAVLVLLSLAAGGLQRRRG